MSVSKQVIPANLDTIIRKPSTRITKQESLFSSTARINNIRKNIK